LCNNGFLSTIYITMVDLNCGHVRYKYVDDMYGSWLWHAFSF